MIFTKNITYCVTINSDIVEEEELYAKNSCLSLQRGVFLVDPLREVRKDTVVGLSHSGVLGSLPGEQEYATGRLLGRDRVVERR